jgi:hypothetical protein
MSNRNSEREQVCRLGTLYVHHHLVSRCLYWAVLLICCRCILSDRRRAFRDGCHRGSSCTHLLAICLVVFKVKRGDVGVATAVLLAPVFVVLAAGYLISIVISLWRAYSPDSVRDAACIKTGVEYTNPPAAPVSAVHVDWDADNPFGTLMKSYSVDSGGHLEAIDQGIPARRAVASGNLPFALPRR